MESSSLAYSGWVRSGFHWVLMDRRDAFAPRVNVHPYHTWVGDIRYDASVVSKPLTGASHTILSYSRVVPELYTPDDHTTKRASSTHVSPCLRNPDRRNMKVRPATWSFWYVSTLCTRVADSSGTIPAACGPNLPQRLSPNDAFTYGHSAMSYRILDLPDVRSMCHVEGYVLPVSAMLFDPGTAIHDLPQFRGCRSRSTNEFHMPACDSSSSTPRRLPAWQFRLLSSLSQALRPGDVAPWSKG